MEIFPEARFEPSKLARGLMEEQGLTLQDAVHAVRNFGSAWQGIGRNQRWFQGPATGGSMINVLLEERAATLVMIIAIYRVMEE